MLRRARREVVVPTLLELAARMDIVESIGNTPLVEIPLGVARLFVKAEWTNPSGSVKARAAASIIADAELRGLKPGDTILDASSGNTGIAYAMIAGARGYRLVLCLPKNASAERKRLLRAYGAEIVLTSPLEGTDGAQAKARELAAEHPEWFYLDQYGNDANWQAHERTTGPEILAQTHGEVTHFVACVGTSGTLVGTARFFASAKPEVVVIEVQPASPFHGLEGVKHMESARTPEIYDAEAASVHAVVESEPAFEMLRRLASMGILVGPSTAAAVVAALRVEAEPTDCIVVIGPDGGERYLSETHLWEAS